jgi:DnaK suppressor protein
MPKLTKSAPKTRFDNYEKLLRKKAEEVRRSMSAQKVAQVVTRLDVPSDEGDLSQQSHEEWIFLNRNTLEIKLLREVEAAVRRIEQGTYGVCHECEEPISPKRLDALPWAKYCVTCQEEIALRAARGEYDEKSDDE